MTRRVSRRRFVSTLAAGVAAPTIISAALCGQDKTKPSERINLGFIGVGTMGRGHLGRFLGIKEVQVVAVCDVVAERRDDARKIVESRYAAEKAKGSYKGCEAYNDFRELLARKDIDAVVIATPDHWHAIPCLLAAKEKKDIYCEKPLSHSVAEGRAIVTAVEKHKVVFQTGSQQRSEFGGRFRTAVELVRNGRLGTLATIHVGVGDPAVACDLTTQEVPKGTDWKLWLGPAAQRGYHEELCPKGIHKHFPAWRKYREFGGGQLADMGAHHFDIAQWALDMDASGPVKIEPPDKDVTVALKLVYANGVELYHGGPSGLTFRGVKDAALYVDRDVLQGDPSRVARKVTDKEIHVYHATDHAMNWLECIRSRKATICPAEVGHRSATICHLANIGYQLYRPLKWDPAKEQFDDKEANKLLNPPLREPWKLEV